MSKEERDIWDDAIRSKLDGFEFDTMPGDWEAIADRLPGNDPIPLRRKLGYWAAAAVVSLLLLSSGLYLFDNEMERLATYDEVVIPVDEVDDKPILPEVVEKEVVKKPLLANVAKPGIRRVTGNSADRSNGIAVASFRSSEPFEGVAQADGANRVVDDANGRVVKSDNHKSVVTGKRNLVADASNTGRVKNIKREQRKWGFGMGGGGFSMGADNLIPQYVTNSSMFKSESLMSLNAFNTDRREPAKTDVRHKTPIGIGFSVSRYLNDRFSLQSGLTYSYLRSEWNTNNAYHIENDQRLHFIGIPLSLTYKIAEWNRLMFYASAGAMTEVNVAGKRRMKLFSDDVEIAEQSERVRMKEWLWSVNAKTGVSYPIISFLSAFAEVGVSYYFDNGSDIETIHSEKPFNVNLQLGFRFGF